MSHSSQNRLMVILIGVVSIVAYQNCSVKNFATNDTPNPVTSSLSLSSLENECPQYNQPICQSGYIAVTTKDENNCDKPACVIDPNAENQCPIYMAPICENGQEIVIEKNENNCDVPRCKETQNSCPIYNMPLCQKGYIVQFSVEENGCERPSCVPDPNSVYQCPQYMLPICAPNAEVVVTKNENGCLVPSCKIKSLVCPDISKDPICNLVGETISTVIDSDGCQRKVCALTPVEKYECPIYNQPICDPGTEVIVQTDNNGCKKPTCVKKNTAGGCNQGITYASCPSDQSPQYFIGADGCTQFFCN